MSDIGTRAEHLRWCKDRALVYINHGDLNSAFASMGSDLGKHSETAPSQQLMPLGMRYVLDNDANGLRRFIEGFN